jgi:hypothetical protein
MASILMPSKAMARRDNDEKRAITASNPSNAQILFAFKATFAHRSRGAKQRLR